MSIRQWQSPGGGKFFVDYSFAMNYCPPKHRTIDTHAQDMMYYFAVVESEAKHITSKNSAVKFYEKLYDAHKDILLEQKILEWLDSSNEKR